MDHPFEQLGEDRFQQFSQALLVSEFPGLQCLPVRQPDGGRDAFARRVGASRESHGQIVFQVKFARQPSAERDPFSWIVRAIRGELDKHDRLIARGMTEFVLVTNMPGTAHLDTGTRDRVQTYLDENLAVPSRCFWREELNTRLAANWDLKWHYPELMAGTDYLRLLVESAETGERQRMWRAIRTYIADQCERDRLVKFKQVDLRNDLLAMFIDVPASAQRAGGGRVADPFRARVQELASDVREEVPDAEMLWLFERGAAPYGAASLLLDDELQFAEPYVVLEGAPGQGKSTTLQYVCQVHRFRVLNRVPELGRIESSHNVSPVRIPFRVDLRHFATWMDGRNPWSDDAPPPQVEQRTLEGFVAAHVLHTNGGAGFSVEDLLRLVETTPVVIGLDGLDEVVDIRDKDSIVRSITEGVRRLGAISRALQIIVTTRPTAFTQAGRLDDELFRYLRLTELPRDLITEYALRWCSARRLDREERHEVLSVLEDRLAEPHIRDLARNPMQLAILLNLIHQSGPALPDQRTQLYTDYMDLFLNREAAKSRVVKSHRSLLITVHGFVAWLLHVQAEEETGQGFFTGDQLLGAVEQFLAENGHERNLFGDVFAQGIDRVGALVSREEGKYEFEVHPLREYFAARYLYETAPNEPSWKAQPGAKPERLNAMVRQPYWLNVARFFAGFYNLGELPSLARCVGGLAGESGWEQTSLPRTLASVLLSDRVFAQDRNALLEVMGELSRGIPSRHCGTSPDSSSLGRDEAPVRLEWGSGGKELVRTCLDAMLDPKLDGRRRASLAKTVIRNSSSDERVAEWRSWAPRTSTDAWSEWIENGERLGVLCQMTDQQVQRITSEEGPLSPTAVASLLRVGEFRPIERSDAVAESALTAILDRFVSDVGGEPNHPIRVLSTLCTMDAAIVRAAARHSAIASARNLVRPTNPGEGAGLYNVIAAFVDRVGEVLDDDDPDWNGNLEPWDVLVEAGRGTFGDRPAFTTLAIASSGCGDRRRGTKAYRELCDDRLALVWRVRYAQSHRRDLRYWRAHLRDAADTSQRVLVTSVLLAWGTDGVVAGLQSELEAVVESLGSDDITLVRESVVRARMSQVRIGLRSEIEELRFATAPSAELFTCAADRLSWAAAGRIFDAQRYQINTKTPDSVAQFLAEAALVDDPRVRDWAAALSVVSAAHQRELPIGIVRPGIAAALPPGIVESVVTRPQDYPLLLVQMAETRVQFDIVKGVPGVGELARTSRWFAKSSGSDYRTRAELEQ